MKSPQRQQGAALITSLIMLVVVTLLVVYSIRAGNTNLRIAGNMQVQAETMAATQQGLEVVTTQIKNTDLISLIPAQTIPVTMNGFTYSVQIPTINACKFEKSIPNSELNTSVADDVPCFESAGGMPRYLGPDGKLNQLPSACKDQLWEVQSSVTDKMSGAQLTQVQGLAIRVPVTVVCP